MLEIAELVCGCVHTCRQCGVRLRPCKLDAWVCPWANSPDGTGICSDCVSRNLWFLDRQTQTRDCEVDS